MVYYVNPTEGTKEQWLENNGVKVNEGHFLNFDYSKSDLPVCLVDYGAFTAAGIVYNADEFNAFIRGHDMRPKTWYQVSKEALKPFSNR